MRKRILTVAVILGFGALLTIGSSLAFFTDTDEAYSVVTMGRIDIEMKEELPVPGAGEVWSVERKTEEGKTVGLEYSNILPGASIEKKAVIANIGTNSAYIREKVTISITGRDGRFLPADGLEFWKRDSVQGSKRIFVWGESETADPSVRKETIYLEERETECMTIYAGDILRKDEDVYLFDYVKVPTSWGNAYAGATIEIKLTGEAIQSDFIEIDESQITHASDRAWQAFQYF